MGAGRAAGNGPVGEKCGLGAGAQTKAERFRTHFQSRAKEVVDGFKARNRRSGDWSSPLRFLR